MAQIAANSMVASVQSETKKTSAAVPNICRGINASNGQDCKRLVASSRIFPYCQLHQAQAHTLHVGLYRTPPGNTAATQKTSISDTNCVVAQEIYKPGIIVCETPTKSPERLLYTSSMLKTSQQDEAAIMSQMSQLTMYTMRPKFHSSNSNPPEAIRLPTAPVTLESAPAHTVIASQAYGSTSSTSQAFSVHDRTRPNPKSSFFSFLKARKTKTSEVATSFESVNHTSGEPIPEDPYVSNSMVFSKSDVKKVPRKPVDFRTREQVTMERKIKENHAELTRLLSHDSSSLDMHSSTEKLRIQKPVETESTSLIDKFSSSSSSPSRMVGQVRSDLQPFRNAQHIRHQLGKTHQDMYFLRRYTDADDYPHKNSKSLTRLQDVLRNVLNAALMVNYDPHELLAPEFVYVFRLDGDYVDTPRISLKIGRSKNVQARLRQWYAQCHYKIDSLEQFETRHSILLERMMHLEFEEDRVVKQCRCGRRHREWFDIRREDARGRIRSKDRERLSDRQADFIF